MGKFVYWCNEKFDLKTDIARFCRYNGMMLCNISEEEFINLTGNNSDNRWQIMQQVLFALQKRRELLLTIRAAVPNTQFSKIAS